MIARFVETRPRLDTDPDTDPVDTVFAFCKAYKEKTSFDLDELYEALAALGYALRQNDPTHDQDAPCANCAHPYERHFDPFEGDREVGCKYCGCVAFVEPEQWKLEPTEG